MESMDTPKKLNEWLIKMGYEGKIPSNLKPFCNPCTALIWEQLIQTVKSKEEITHIRNNILINKLLRNDETCLNSSISFLKLDKKPVIREIKVWNRKKTLEKQLCAVQDDICDNKTKLKSAVNNNKIKYMNLENWKQKVAENQQVIFLLNKKSEQLETEINDVEEMLTLARNLTPVENEGQNKTEVLETLRMCSEKLEKIVEKQNESRPVSRVNTESILEQKTPHNKIFKSRRALSSQKKSVIFSSTKIINQTKIKPKQDRDDSLGLLDDLSITFDSTLPASSFKDTNFSNVNMCYDIAILNDKKLNSLVEEALYKNDRHVLWNVLFELNKNSKAQLIDLIVDNDKKTSR
ncbi:hypothetical protein ILUMI_05764 [Ignelater luminosus]|uniref:Uncharacterized protein n=1 Tax=Ignelater luminosus TaxID=2038154 RepID=A0A8K0D6J7_IGNLU|nr:hypothetical protein ILUMI_05764 [Ignelater luminosus]